MSFIRTKKFNGKEYAYLVESKWYKRKLKGKSKGPRQKVSKYLGRVYFFEKANNIEFFDFKIMEKAEQYLVNNTYEEIIKDLVRWEIYRHNISIKDFSINLDGKKITKEGKDVSLGINEGILNNHTLKRLFNLQSDDSLYLAKAFVEAGIEIPKEVFVGLFSQ